MPHIFLAFAIAAVSFAPLLVRLAQPIPAVSMAAMRVLLAGVLLAVVAGRKWEEITALSAFEKGLVGLAGVSLGAHFALWMQSLAWTSTAAAVSLVATQPIFAGVLGYVVLREGFRRQELVGMLIALAGTAALAGSDLGSSSPTHLAGDLCALAAAATVPIYLLVGRHLRDKVSLTPFLASVNLVAGAVLVLLATVEGTPFRGFAGADYVAVVGLALVPSIIGHTLLNYCVRLVPVHLVSLGILVEPVAAAATIWMVFGEVPTQNTVVGGLAILVGVYYGFAFRRSSPAPKPPRAAT